MSEQIEKILDEFAKNILGYMDNGEYKKHRRNAVTKIVTNLMGESGEKNGPGPIADKGINSPSIRG